MNKENIEAIIWDYLEYRLNPEERKELESLIESNSFLKQEFTETKSLWLRMEENVVPKPSDNMQLAFNEMLVSFRKTELQKSSSIFDTLKNYFAELTIPRLAMSSLLVIFGLSIGYLLFDRDENKGFVSSQIEVEKLSNEVHEMKEMMMLAMLQNPQANERMKAVSYTKELNTVDDKVVNALLTTFMNDNNDNVRLVALKALVIEAKESDWLREELVNALMNEQSPILQVALADAMISLQERESVGMIKKRLKENALDKSVKQKFESTIKLLQA